jgi:3-deoxy-D-manno-octulosonate 8-phosphate phosphatase (KDO 8-P phosphatase)
MRVDLVFEDISPKTSVLDKIIKIYKVTPEELCFIGDDLVDLCLMKKVGIPVAVANAAPEIKKAAVLVTEKSGGRGAVREMAELILKTQGKWEQALKAYDI